MEPKTNHPKHPRAKRPQAEINATQLKFLAILAMLIDHLAWAFVPTDSIQGQVMHAIGRFTFPIMAFFIAEGFHYTRNFKKYLGRLAIFAVISHFAFQYYQYARIPLFSPRPEDTFLTVTYTSVLYTLGLGLIALWVLKTWQADITLRYLIIFILCILATPGDYMFYAPVLILVFGNHFGDRDQQFYSGLFIVAFLIISVIQVDLLGNLYMIATILPLLFLRHYNGEQGASRNFLVKYGFYLFYPLHLFLIAWIRYALLGLPPIASI